MKHAYALLTLLLPSLANAQLINGSFENEEGFDLTGWTSICGNAIWGIGGYEGDWSVALPHGETNGCAQSDLIQYVPAIQDGETWTISGWCMNWNWMQSNPYIGFRMGIKRADGTMDYFTAGVASPNTWYHLTFANTFDINPGDTAFVMCDGGFVNNNAGNNWGQFDAVDVQLTSTAITERSTPAPAFRPNPAADKLWIDLPEQVIAITVVDVTGREHALHTFHHNERSLEVDVSSIPGGLCVMRVNTASGLRTLRFLKT